MMEPLTLEEFANNLRTYGTWSEVEFATEILDLIHLEEDVAEPYSDLCADIEHSAPTDLKDNHVKALERLNDRSHLLDEIEKHFSEAGYDDKVDTADNVKIILGTLSDAEDILETAGWPGDGDFIESLHELAERAARAPEETEVMAYDL